MTEQMMLFECSASALETPGKRSGSRLPGKSTASSPKGSEVLGVPDASDPHGLRPYQREAVTAIFRELATVRSTLAVMFTGAGKTQIGGSVIRSWENGRILWLAHRDELLNQAQRRIEHMTGRLTSLEQAGQYASNTRVVVGSVQSLRGSRLERFSPDAFGLVIIDEAHHSPSKSYRAIVDHFSSAKVMGITATADRLDGVGQHNVFDSVAYRKDIGCHHEPRCATPCGGIEEGYLVPILCRSELIDSVNLAKIKTVSGDLALDALEEEILKGAAAIVDATLEHVGSRRSLTFTPGVASAHKVCDTHNERHPGSAHVVDGKMHPDKRREILKAHRRGDFQHLVNCMVFCLDEKTEILTSDGWVGIDTMSYEHLVANWDDGKIFFREPQHIVVRDRLPQERMVILETPRRSIRVTERHRMLCRTYENGAFKIKHAGDLVGKKTEFPVSGYAEPFSITAPDPVAAAPNISFQRRIQATSYYLRRTAGLDKPASEMEAERRLHRRDGLRHIDPDKLSAEQCAFIGFWLGDGTRTALRRGGVEYSICQGEKYPRLISWLRSIIVACGFHFLEKKARGMVRWIFPRGTGSGSQERDGLFPIEPYLNKSGSPLYWGLNESQFAWLLHGLHMADGIHRDDPSVPGRFDISGVVREKFDLLQAIASCRGYRTSLLEYAPRTSRSRSLLVFSASKRVGHRATKYPLQWESGWIPERVWCVTSDTGNIITRRRGTVTVTGNTEGYDDVGIAAIINARPTKSRSLATQIWGRGLRVLAGIGELPTIQDRLSAIAASAKPDCLLLDVTGEPGKHKLISPLDLLGGRYTSDVVAKAKELLLKEVKLAEEALVQAEIVLREEDEERKKLVAKAAAAAEVRRRSGQWDPFSDGGIRDPDAMRPAFLAKPSTPRQKGWAIRNCLDPNLSCEQLKKLFSLDVMRDRFGKASFRMLGLLRKHGLPAGMETTQAEASRLLRGREWA